MTDILPTINSPEDIKKLSLPKLNALADEIREEIIRVVNSNGGHLGSNLGTVELTLALHYCYDFSKDRLVWDVGHQCYTHKLITGRREQFETLRRMGGLSGFPNKEESDFDPFTTGHSGAAISTALGLACGESAMKGGRSVVAVVGDGAIAAGMAFEALNHAGSLGTDLLVVLNDNKMSISKSVGALSGYLTQLRSAPVYMELKKEIGHVLDLLPILGGQMKQALDHIKDAIRNSITPGRMFADLGFRYYGPIDGHRIEELIETFKDVKDLGGPTLLHVVTEKGRGHEEAQNHHHRMHAVAPEKVPARPEVQDRPGWTAMFSEHLAEIAAEDPAVATITAAMPDVTAAFQQRFPNRCFDPGICEQHAIGLAAGLATAGMKPVVALYSTFLQRAYDQVFHEICLQGLPVVIAIDRAGLVGSDGPTHHGVFDIAYLRHLPEMTLMAPKDVPEMRKMLEAAIAWRRPCAIRYPRDSAPEDSPRCSPVERGKAEILREGPDALIVAYGSMVFPAMRAADMLQEDGLDVTVMNARFAKPLDEEAILSCLEKSPVAITVEEGALAGGFGSAVLECAAGSAGTTRIRRLGVPDRFIEHGSREELLEMLGLNPAGIAAAVKQAVREEDK